MRFAACLVAWAALAGGAQAAPSGSVPSDSPGEARPGDRMHFAGYSVQLPLQGPWGKESNPNADLMLVARASETHTLSLWASSSPMTIRFANVDELAAYVRRELEAQFDRRRYAQVDTSIVADAFAAQCVRAKTTGQFRMAPNTPGLPFLFEATQLMCVHPQAAEQLVSVVHVERFRHDERSGIAEAAGEQFLASLRFGEPDPHIKLAVAQALLGPERRPQEAEKLIREAIEIFARRKQALGLADAYREYGHFFASAAVEESKLYRDRGFLDGLTAHADRHRRALEYLDKAAALFEEQKRFDALANVHLNRGRAYARMGESKVACSAFDQSLESARRNQALNPGARPILPSGYSSIEDYVAQAKARVCGRARSSIGRTPMASR